MKGFEMWQKFCQQNNIDINTPHDEWKFCGRGPLSDKLANLVLEGIKTATVSSKIAYEFEHEPLPEAGFYKAILYNNGDAAFEWSREKN
ncbi:MAG: hypothetical protein PUC65_05895 [Clostridiales bacterium]|nr:hypothetical protein [Clostridiales bacterium]